MAPEAFGGGDNNKQCYTYASDLYSAGLVLWECVERRNVFHETEDQWELKSRICLGNRLERAECRCPIADLIERCLRLVPKKRISASKALEDANVLKMESFYQKFCKEPSVCAAPSESTAPLSVIGARASWEELTIEEKTAWYAEKYNCAQCKSKVPGLTTVATEIGIDFKECARPSTEIAVQTAPHLKTVAAQAAPELRTAASATDFFVPYPVAVRAAPKLQSVAAVQPVPAMNNMKANLTKEEDEVPAFYH
ncbi:unnamed protein product, partial [Mesorhabditis spiculigera]